MARSTIALALDSTVTPPKITATAVDEAGNQSPSGHLFTRANRKIQWVHGAPGVAKPFAVTFVDQTDPGGPPWPFTPSTSTTLTLADGKTDEKQLKFHSNKDWKYTVTMTGCEPLDPMIIIRSRTSRAAATVALLGGIAAGALVAWAYLTHWS